MKLNSKCQVTIPKRIRNRLAIGPGSLVEFELAATGEVVLRPAVASRRQRGASRIAGLRGRATVRLRTNEIMALTRGV